jgi:hypothetical protein
MDTSCKTAVVGALAGGYVLGRTRKAKVAFALVTYLAGRRFNLAPQQLATEGMRQLRENPRFAELREQIQGELMTAVRSAVSASADRRFASLAETLRKRGAQGKPPEDEENWSEEEGEFDEEGEEEEEEEGQAPQRRARRPRDGERAERTAGRRAPRKEPAEELAAKKTGPAKRARAKKAAPAGKTAARKTARGGNRSRSAQGGR